MLASPAFIRASESPETRCAGCQPRQRKGRLVFGVAGLPAGAWSRKRPGAPLFRQSQLSYFSANKLRLPCPSQLDLQGLEAQMAERRTRDEQAA